MIGLMPAVLKMSSNLAVNRTVKNEDTVRTTFTYDVANQLNTSVAAAGTTTYTFGADGNQQLVKAPNGDLTTTTWNYENQPTKIAFPAGTRATYTYNADNRRVRKET